MDHPIVKQDDGGDGWDYGQEGDEWPEYDLEDPECLIMDKVPSMGNKKSSYFGKKQVVIVKQSDIEQMIPSQI